MQNMVPFEQRLLLARIDMETQQQLYDNMVTHCFTKCISKLDYAINSDDYKWGELTVKEMSCTDRCVQKYVQSQELTKKRMEKSEHQKQQQMELTQKAQQKIEKIQHIFQK